MAWHGMAWHGMAWHGMYLPQAAAAAAGRGACPQGLPTPTLVCQRSVAAEYGGVQGHLWGIQQRVARRRRRQLGVLPQQQQHRVHARVEQHQGDASEQGDEQGSLQGEPYGAEGAGAVGLADKGVHPSRDAIQQRDACTGRNTTAARSGAFWSVGCGLRWAIDQPGACVWVQHSHPPPNREPASQPSGTGSTGL